MFQCNNSDARLFDPDDSTSRPTYGIVQICVAGVWTPVCGMGLDMDEAEAACGLVGFPNATIGMGHLLPFIYLLNPFLYLSN